ncbi:hypothetical protein M787_000170 [Chlamydia gallinacea 08-1274/3]|uniref:Uncharacterized protein n=1 Tax=Chlamydia gallinacea 08-1274/3 TaxID=1143323 RepID=A0A173DXW5_9CHLA|nr:hypothetical protein [Chlamydia gallinacea]ANG65747.1 hypothetical protein M787_000170 [Chlamydia gallinacea 08-1274/3]
MKRQEKMHPLPMLFQLFLIMFLSLPFGLKAQEISSFKKNIFLAHPGDYAVLSKGSQKIFLLVKSISPDAVWLEITEFPHLSPSERTLVKDTPWKTLIHTLKAHKKISLIYLSYQDTRVFSFNSKTHSWIPSNQNDLNPFLSTLLHLSLRNAPTHLIKTQGKDQTPWSPKVSLNGMPSVKIPTQAKHTFWPPDTSALSGRSILMYFTVPDISVFPIWISIDTPKGEVIVRAIDVGHDATSPLTYSLPTIK